jgi:ribosomal protein S27E
MATLCRNCSHPLVFDPAKQKMYCSSCGSSFLPEEVEAESKEYRQDLRAESMESIYNTKDKDLMDCYVYSCSECGGEIIINGTEASTTCVYCGNSNVVFSRIAKQKCPEFVMPFSITKEKAIELVHKKINSGLFIPKEIKNFSIDCIRGIYLPYWIINASYTNAAVIEGQVRSGKSTVTRYFGRAGKLKLTRFPIDASLALSDESSSRLEPFELSHLKPFDEDYLAGFYSNVSDVTYIDLKRATNKRAQEFFEKEAMDDVRASRKKVVSSIPSLKIENNMVYAMLPAWFITFKYKGKPNTILVNGDTGKVVCALPWNKGLFYSLLFTFGAVATTAAYFVFRYTLPVFFMGRSSSSSSDSRGKIIALLVAGIIALFSVGIRKIIKVVKNIQLTQDKKMFNFTKKRQG